MEYVQRSSRDLGPNAVPTFDNMPFDIPKVVKVLNDLAKLSEVFNFFFCGISVVLIMNFLGENWKYCRCTRTVYPLLVCVLFSDRSSVNLCSSR